ncbi:MAG: periplasmic heavy metal sensor [Pseudomonadota bacterium]
MSPAPELQKPRSPLWMRVALIGSLAVNLAVAGVVVGTMMRVTGPDGPPRTGPPAGVIIYRVLPDEERRDMRAKMRDINRTSRESRARLVAGLPDALRADPPDLATVEALVQGERDRMLDWQTQSYVHWLEQVRAMSPETRSAYADRLEEAFVRRGRHGSKRDKD